MTSVRFSTFPRTEPPPVFTKKLVNAFVVHESSIGTMALEKGLESDAVLRRLCPDLQALGFEVELDKKRESKIRRPVFFGENGIPSLQYEIDAFHTDWRCGLEIEAGRAWMGNAVYRDLIQALVMVELDYLALAVPNGYRYFSSGRTTVNRDYDKTCAVADALFSHSRIRMPYTLLVIGY